ncbi:YvrJ family protein [Clostridium sp. JS66]|uniref:YvrJ family protein n=1 Tax=Clostridium sp. JS66 TaxID=3064705 RepID=UPI00399A6604
MEVIVLGDLVNLIGNVGFPIAVSIYLLVRIEGKMEILTQSINNLSNVINDTKNNSNSK